MTPHKKTSAYGLKWSAHVLLISLIILATGCSENGEDKITSPDDVWDIEANGVPRFVATDYIELAKIDSISKFRSAVGHSYGDAFEQCRSMKHYFKPKTSVDWSTVKIYAPVSGTITRVEQEAVGGTKIEIASAAYPAFRFSIFHINLSMARSVNDPVTAGEQLGTHIGSQTYSDISVIVNDPTHQGRMVSYFQVITDSVFAAYAQRGVAARDSLIIPRAVRDAHPLTCSGDAFVTTDSLENWVILQ